MYSGDWALSTPIFVAVGVGGSSLCVLTFTTVSCVDLLSCVHRYNIKVRAGRGFTANELKVRFQNSLSACVGLLVCVEGTAEVYPISALQWMCCGYVSIVSVLGITFSAVCCLCLKPWPCVVALLFLAFGSWIDVSRFFSPSVGCQDLQEGREDDRYRRRLPPPQQQRACTCTPLPSLHFRKLLCSLLGPCLRAILKRVKRVAVHVSVGVSSSRLNAHPVSPVANEPVLTTPPALLSFVLPLVSPCFPSPAGAVRG